jgi:hypothetical protein
VEDAEMQFAVCRIAGWSMEDGRWIMDHGTWSWNME